MRVALLGELGGEGVGALSSRARGGAVVLDLLAGGGRTLGGRLATLGHLGTLRARGGELGLEAAALRLRGGELGGESGHLALGGGRLVAGGGEGLLGARGLVAR